jgi:hypothetical protein
MTKQEFLALTPDRKSLKLIRTEEGKYYHPLPNNAPPDPEFYFWNTVIASLVEYLDQPAKIRKVTSWNAQNILDMIERAIASGRRKDLVIPFN